MKRLINGNGAVAADADRLGYLRHGAALRGSHARCRCAGKPRSTSAPITVDPIRIQESGLLKDDIVLDFPAETGDFSTVLLRRVRAEG